MYNFDEILDRRGTSCLKYDTLKEEFGRTDLHSFWIADMDFRTPDFIMEALRKRLDCPVLGYPSTGSDFFPMIARWVRELHGWDVDPADFCFIPGIVKGIGFAERCFLKPGDKVIIQPPVYHPFRLVTKACGFEVVNNPLKPLYDVDGFVENYEMDLDHFESLIDDRTKMMILCNPHNPGGVVFPVETLRRLAEICDRRGIIVLSDEIHGEMALAGHKQHPFASVSDAAARCSISFLAPSKTFNIAGVVSSYCIVLNPDLRKRFFDYLDANEINYPCIFSAIATRAAYTTKGMEWRGEMLSYVEENVDFVDSWLRTNLPQIRAMRPQASFLIWLDCHRLGLPQEKLVELFVDKAHLALNDGTMFGAEGEGFMRLNIGCPRACLKDALESLAAAVDGR